MKLKREYLTFYVLAIAVAAKALGLTWPFVAVALGALLVSFFFAPGRGKP